MKYERGSIIFTANQGFAEGPNCWAIPSLPPPSWTGYSTTAKCSISSARANASARNAGPDYSRHSNNSLRRQWSRPTATLAEKTVQQ